MKKIGKIFIFLGVVLGLFAAAGIVLAQTYAPLAPLPGTYTGSASAATTDLSTYLSGAIKLLIAVSGAIAVLMLIIAGAKYVAAGINPSAKSDAKGDITNALIGLVLVLTSYLILNTIDPKLVHFNLTLPPVGGIPTSPSAVTASPTTPAAPHPTPPGGSALHGGSTSSTVPPPSVTPPLSLWSSIPSSSGPSAASSIVPTAATVNAANDYSIMRYCLTSSGSLCTKADINHDGKIDSTDLLLFVEGGALIDLNGDSVVGLGAATTPTSCFFKKNTVAIGPLLPLAQSSDSMGWANPSSCNGNGGTLPPTLGCNGATWLKASDIGRTCAADMSFGYDYTGTGQYTKFQNWVMGATSGTKIDLSTLFVRAFYDTSLASNWANDGVTGFSDTLLSDVTYTTMAQYDLNGDGIADFSASGADMAKFNSCIGAPVSGSCTQADFNGDGVIDNYDLMFWNFVLLKLFAASSPVFYNGSAGGGIPTATYLNSLPFVPYHWDLNQYESMFFAANKYSDKQIVNYCVGRKPFEKCASSDIDGSCLAQYRNCGTDMSCRAAAEACKVNSADVAAFDTKGAQLDLNSDGRVDLK